MNSKIVNDDFYIILSDDYKDEDVLPVMKLKSGVEFEIIDEEIASIVIPNLIKQIPPQLMQGKPIDDINIEIADLEFIDDGMLILSLDIEGTIIKVQFDCAELRNRNI